MRLRQWVESHLTFARKKAKKLKQEEEKGPPAIQGPPPAIARRGPSIRTSFQSPGTPPKERCLIRTNPWLPSPRSDSSGLGSSLSSISASSLCSTPGPIATVGSLGVRRRHSDSRLTAVKPPIPLPKSNSLPRDGPLQPSSPLDPPSLPSDIIYDPASKIQLDPHVSVHPLLEESSEHPHSIPEEEETVPIQNESENIIPDVKVHRLQNAPHFELSVPARKKVIIKFPKTVPSEPPLNRTPVTRSPSLPQRSRVKDLIHNFESIPKTTTIIATKKKNETESLSQRIAKLQTQKSKMQAAMKSLREWDLESRMEILRVRMGILNCRRQMITNSLARCLA